jgi:hypothetical protein
MNKVFKSLKNKYSPDRRHFNPREAAAGETL